MSTPETPPSAGGDDPGRGLSGVQRTGVVLGALAVLPIVFAALRSNGDDSGASSSSAPRSKTGDQVRLKVRSDTADEIHVHGYDLKKDLEAGGSVQFAFEASIEGRFDIERENAGTQIANLEVDPA